MTKIRILLLGAGLAALGTWALAQSLVSYTLTGQESWQAAIGGPGGPSVLMTTGQTMNSQGIQTTALTSGALTISNTISDLITTAAVTGALTVTTPPSPWNGEIFELVNGSGSANTATVTFTANTGQTVNGGAVATLANQASAEWRYVVATATWYRLR